MYPMNMCHTFGLTFDYVVEQHSTKKWAFHALSDTIMKVSTQIVLLVTCFFDIEPLQI